MNLNVRLAYNPGPVNQYKALDNYSDMPAEDSTHTNADAPALLVSYVYLSGFRKNQHRYHYRDWVLDSGAFSAHNSGTVINLQEYIDTAKELMAVDPTLTEIFALDVIGDFKASIKNCEEMWRQGVPAIPCFHRGSPWSDLKSVAKDYPKVALGGVAMLRGNEKMTFAREAFNLVWPKKLHGFGYGGEKQVMALPWHSVDATNWEVGPCRFGRWNHFGKMSVRGSEQNLRKEVEFYLEVERAARFKWRREMKTLSDLDNAATGQLAARTELFNSLTGPDVRLAHSAQLRPWREGKLGLEKAYASDPTIRLAVSGGDKVPSRVLTLGKENLQDPTVRLAVAGTCNSRADKALTQGPDVRLALPARDTPSGVLGYRHVELQFGHQPTSQQTEEKNDAKKRK